MTRKRILFLINSLEGGGAERVMSTLLRHSASERERYDIVLGLLDNLPAAYTVPDWVEVRQLDGAQSFLRSIMAVRRLVAEVRPHLTLSFLTRSNIANVLSARTPCVISERANTSAHFSGGLREMLSRAVVRVVYPRATRVIAVSEGVADDLRDNFGVRADRLIAIPNPVDMDAICAKAAEPPSVAIEGSYILAAGRLVASKNFSMLIRAFAASDNDCTLVIAGEGPEREALARLASEHGVGKRVLLPGFVANPYPLMRSADVFVLSSNVEGFPNALVEAMALGTPVIATNCTSGPSEILAEAARAEIAGLTMARHGVLVDAYSTEQMAQALDRMRDGEVRRTYGAKAAERARVYSPESVKDRYWSVLREALSE
jgi:glycosyltransferase involved in cell wall biosynthesis